MIYLKQNIIQTFISRLSITVYEQFKIIISPNFQDQTYVIIMLLINV